MRTKSSTKPCFALHKVVRLRQRYIFTKGNKLRLRYMAGSALFVLAVSSSVVSSSGMLSLGDSAAFEVAVAPANAPAEAIVQAALVESPARSSGKAPVEADDAARLAVIEPAAGTPDIPSAALLTRPSAAIAKTDSAVLHEKPAVQPLMAKIEEKTEEKTGVKAEDAPDAPEDVASAQTNPAASAEDQPGLRMASLQIARKLSESFQKNFTGGLFARLTGAADSAGEHQIEVGEGDTIAGVLEKAGVSSEDAFQVVKSMREHYDPRKIKPGQVVVVRRDPADIGSGRDGKYASSGVGEIEVKLDAVNTLHVTKDDEGAFETAIKESPLVERPQARSVEIKNSLYASAAAAGIPAAVIADVIRVYSYDVDFQRDIQPGDRIEVMYNTFENEQGDFARNGDVIYANLSIGGKNIPIYRYEQDGNAEYYDDQGRSIRKALMKTPIDGARITSGFGMRRHPILGYTKMHKGMDFGAPLGTPVFAAGDGTIEKAGRNGAYGNYVRIRHNGDTKTAYAHLHKFADGIKGGKRVKQGQVIGYVGSTGRSTGPHLHFEVLVNNTQVNPAKVDMRTGDTLKGKALKKFKAFMEGLRQQFAKLHDGESYAMQEAQPSNRKVR